MLYPASTNKSYPCKTEKVCTCQVLSTLDKPILTDAQEFMPYVVDITGKRTEAVSYLWKPIRIWRMPFHGIIIAVILGTNVHAYLIPHIIDYNPIALMHRKGEPQSDDPYELIRKLRSIVDSQRQTIEEYNLICDSVISEKNAALQQASRLKKENQHLAKKIEKQAFIKANLLLTSQQVITSKQLKDTKSSQLPSESPLRNKDVSNSNLTLLGSPSQMRKKQSKGKEFVPHDVQFAKKKHQNFSSLNCLNESTSEVLQQSLGDFLIQDFLVISPDILQLKKKRQALREEKEIKIEQFAHFNYNKIYSSKKKEYLIDVANRSFPLGAIAKRKTIENIEQFKIQMEFIAEGKMSEDVFILNLKGDFNEPPHSDRVFLGNCNPFRALFAVCLKVPDFIPIKDQKHYQRSEQQIWKVQKVYALLTYYPFIDIHLSILAKIHNLLKPHWHDLHRQEVFARNLSRNLAQAQKNEQLQRLITYFMSKIPDFNQICIFEKHYFGTVPNFGKPIEYSLPKFACSVFFSIFAYEEVLLLLAALFLQKTIIFVGKNESATTLCALFLVTFISPFTYNHHLILNCNAEMVQNIVFGFPLTLVATLKKDAVNFPSILTTFIDNTINHFRGFKGKSQSSLILVDVDSNSIFYDHELNKVFEKVIVQPSKQFREAYHEVNSSHSKSFTFPKKMPVELISRPKNDYEKNAEEKKKLLKEYQQKIDNNMSKWPTFKVQDPHLKVLSMLTEYVSSFSIDRENVFEILKFPKEERVQQVRLLLAKKHPDKQQLIEAITGSQIFADYLDQLEKNYPPHFYH